MLPPEQKTQQQSTKNTLNKNDPIFHESSFFQNHGKRQIKKVFVSAELIVATVWKHDSQMFVEKKKKTTGTPAFLGSVLDWPD